MRRSIAFLAALLAFSAPAIASADMFQCLYITGFGGPPQFGMALPVDAYGTAEVMIIDTTATTWTGSTRFLDGTIGRAALSESGWFGTEAGKFFVVDTTGVAVPAFPVALNEDGTIDAYTDSVFGAVLAQNIPAAFDVLLTSPPFAVWLDPI